MNFHKATQFQQFDQEISIENIKFNHTAKRCGRQRGGMVWPKMKQ